MRHKQETNSDHFARWPQQSSTWPRCCRPNRPPRLAPVSTVCLPRVDTCIHILPSYLAATQVTLEIQTRHASDVFKVDSVADVTLLHVQFSYQDILNVASTHLTPLSHLNNQNQNTFWHGPPLYILKVWKGQQWLQCYILLDFAKHGFHVWSRRFLHLNTSDLLFTPDTPGHGARHRAGPRGLAPLPALRHAHLRLPGRAANDPSVFTIM